MKTQITTCLVFAAAFLAANILYAQEIDELWSHVKTDIDPGATRNLSAEFFERADGRELKLTIPESGISWLTIDRPVGGGWDFSATKTIQAKVENTGANSGEITLWVVADRGWSAVGSAAVLKPGESKLLSCNLRETYPDKTSKINPNYIKEIRIMVQRNKSTSFKVTKLIAAPEIAEQAWVRHQGRLDLPELFDGKPTPGRRVRYQLPADKASGIYSILYLPPNWKPSGRYPVIAEFPGNVFYRATACWSTGRPEQCDMGYGITKGKGAILLSLPFVDRETQGIAESGFGSNAGEDTMKYALSMLDDICSNWGGDRQNLYLCGFSRGSIACGYIGLRNQEIGSLWKGLIGCQHYDGSRWKQSNIAGAVKRAPHFKGKAIFQIDNSQEKYQPVVDATDPSVAWTWTQSKLGYHATAMFLDDRPSTVELRSWFWGLVGK